MLARLVCALLLLVPSSALAALDVIPVPWNQDDPTVPHAAYNGRPTTFKAIARGGNGTYDVSWDFDGNGTFDTTFTTTDRFNLGTSFQLAPQASRVTFDAVVQVQSGGEIDTAIYPVRVFPEVPSDPSFATDRQLQIMRNVAIDDALWWLHTQMGRTGDETNPFTGSQIEGYVNHPNAANTFFGREQASSGFLWALGLNGHYVAFPPGTYVGTFPAGHESVNAFRWATDPYAEDALRLVNSHLTRARIVFLPAADESNRYGVYPEVTRTPIPGTDDGIGIYIGASPTDQTTNPMGYALAALSVSRLTGLIAQVGDPNQIRGKTFEHVIQQMVDALTWAQMEGGGNPGAWYYTPNSSLSDAWESLSAITGLWVADRTMSSSGVIVSNQAKVRIATHFTSAAKTFAGNQSCLTYMTSMAGCDFPATSFATLYAGWMGIDKFSPTDPTIAFPSWSGVTRGQLRMQHDRYQSFVASQWRTWQENTDTNWTGGLWELGTDGLADFERTDRFGNGYSMFHFANAARAFEPDLASYGTNNWLRQFSIYDIQNQYPDGHTESLWIGSSQPLWETNAGRSWMSTGWTALTLTGDGIPPLPVAEASATSAVEGTPITFDATQSDPGTDGGAGGFTWQFGNGESSTQPVTIYAYPDNGIFNAGLFGSTTADIFPVTITNADPVVDAGNDRTSSEGSVVAVSATIADAGANDTHTFQWDFGDGTTSIVRSTSHVYADDGAFALVGTATDDDGGAGSDPVTVMVANVAPSLTSMAPAAASEGSAYSYTLTFTDPGTMDTHVCSLPVKPAGMTLAGCTASWTPTYAGLGGAASAAVEICVTDDDMGMSCEAYSIAVSLTDADGDGLPDGWETVNFGSTAAQDSTGDPDLDGLPNVEEYAAQQDPNAFDGPSAPTLLSPSEGSVANAAQVAFVLVDANDPQGDALTYEFELATDATFATILDSAAGVDETPATTAWTSQVSLTEDERYCWRARSDDGAAASPWSAPACFLRSATNDPPGAPVALAPVATTDAVRPVLTWMAAVDPEDDAVFYDVELASAPDFSTLVASATGVPGGNVVLDTDLADGTTYHWRVRGVDGNGAAGAWSVTADFAVDLGGGGDGGGGCGCSLGSSQPPALASALLALAAVVVRRRRRR